METLVLLSCIASAAALMLSIIAMMVTKKGEQN
jgi:hypothetical protein